MVTSMNIHMVQSLTLEAVYLENDNSLSLRIERENDSLDITLFGLPSDFINRAVSAFGEPNRLNYHREATVYPKELADLRSENERLRQRVALLEGERVAAV